MEFRAVGSRCAVDLGALNLSFSREEILRGLEKQGFKVIHPSPVALARGRVGVSVYRRSAGSDDAPGVVDCSSLVKWVYGQCGLWLPRRSIQQRNLGKVVAPTDLRSGDVVFTSGHINYYYDDPTDGVGHVGIATGDGTIVHAANRKVGVIESAVEGFLEGEPLRGIRRYFSEDQDIVVFETPPARHVEVADDLRWIFLQSFGRRV